LFDTANVPTQQAFSLIPDKARLLTGLVAQIPLTKAVDPSALSDDTAVTGDARNPAAGRSATNNLKLEEAMKMRLLFALAALAIGLALPTFAQQKDTVDPRIAQQRDLIGDPKAIGEFGDLHRELDEAYEKNDAAAVAALFT
jgi:hypothetical protein